MALIKTQPVIVTVPKRDEYSFGYVIQHRKSWKKLQPETQAAILRAAADYLEAEVAGMRERAEALVTGDGR